MRSRAVFVAAASAILAACGGGGGDGGQVAGASEPSPPPTPPGPTASLTEGLYLAPRATGSNDGILVLNGGETWVNLDPVQPGDKPFFAHGTAALLNQTNSNGTTTDGGVTALVAGTFGSNSALVSTSPSMLLGAGAFSFTSDPTADGKSTALTVAGHPTLHLASVQGDGYDYQRPASLANIAGSRNGTLRVDAAGAISSDSSLCNTTPECAYVGTLRPRADGKNVFDVTVAVTGPSCAVAGNYSGVAYQTGIRLHLFAVDSQKTRVLNPRLDQYYTCF